MRDEGLAVRSNQTEILDDAPLSEAEIAQCYRELRGVNRWLGNHWAVLRRLRGYFGADCGPGRRVLDIGCGQGALLVEIREKLGVAVVGFDLRPAPVGSPVEIVAGDAVIDALPRADVAVSMMTAHHLSEAELIGMIRNVGRSCDALILLDLVRHPVPLVLFRIFVAPWLGRVNALDGATSIRRAFTAGEMRRVVAEAVGGPGVRWRQTVAPFWTRQVVEVWWETEKGSSLGG